MNFTATITQIQLLYNAAGAVTATVFTLTPNTGQAGVMATSFNISLAGEVTSHAIGAQITVTLA